MNAPLPLAASARWNARLSLAYARVGGRTVPVLRSHHGPLRIQKGFTPEGPDLWHQVIVHPPGGIASGDALAIEITAQPGARALLTSPGAAKWYRANPLASEPEASQTVSLSVAEGASVEWLPLETIVFSGAQARWRNRFELAGNGVLVAAELVCLGRPASGLAFETGSAQWQTEVLREGELVFFEQAELVGGDALLSARTGLAGAPAFATLLFAGDDDPVSRAVAAVRTLSGQPFAGDWGITQLPGLAVLRWRGPGAEAGWALLRAAWASARPALLGRTACAPRIWAT
jgi:urease accessory protein